MGFVKARCYSGWLQCGMGMVEIELTLTANGDSSA